MKMIKITGRIEAQLSSWHLQYVCKKANFLCIKNPLNYLPFRIWPSVFFTLTLFKYFSSGFFKYCGRLANHKKFIEIYSEIFKFVKLFQSETKNLLVWGPRFIMKASGSGIPCQAIWSLVPIAKEGLRRRSMPATSGEQYGIELWRYISKADCVHIVLQ